MSETEVLTPWRPVEGIAFAFAGAEIWNDYPRLYIRLVDGRTEAKEQSDLCLLFEEVHAFAVHEEFVHPSQGTVYGREPVISEQDSYTFPLLTVSGSAWFSAISDELDIKASGHVHYRFCTGFPVIDVASATPPTVYWLRRPAPPEESALPQWVRRSTGAL